MFKFMMLLGQKVMGSPYGPYRSSYLSTIFNSSDDPIKGLYSLVGQRGFYFKNSKGYDGLGGATIQVTKNFKTLGVGYQNYCFTSCRKISR